MMQSNQNEAQVKKNISRTKHLSIVETCLSGILMGFIGYSGSFSAVPIAFTISSLIFGTKSLITIFATAFSQLFAGYLHTHSSRAGIALSTKIFHGFYIAKPEIKNRRFYNETRLNSLKRFFISNPLNALVINLMWQTFTFFYLLQSELVTRYIEYSILQRKTETNPTSSTEELQPYLIVIHGITRYLAGCLSGMSTGLINHLWQRHLALKKNPQAIFNTDRDKLKLRSHDRRKLLSPMNAENWIKASVMIIGASFVIASNTPNITGFHLFSTRKKKFITDILVVNGGWFYVRDCAMLLFKKQEKPPKIPLNTIQSSPIVEPSKTIEDEQIKMLTNEV